MEPLPPSASAPLAHSSTAPPAVPMVLGEACDEFLPGPGRWAGGLTRALLLTLAAAGLSLSVWPLRETVRAAGVVRPRGENSVIQSELGGTVQAVLLRPDQTVAAGQVLARLDPSLFRSERDQLRSEITALERQLRLASSERDSLELQAAALARLGSAQLESSRRSVDQARATFRFERSELERYQSLLSSGAVPRSLVEEKLSRSQVSAAELLKADQAVVEQRARALNEAARLRQSAAQARSAADELGKQLVQRRTRLDQVERALGRSTLRAPQAGTVLSTALRHPGQVIQPGQVVATIAPLGQRHEVRLEVPARDIGQIRPGQRASLRISACPTAEYGVLPAVVQSLSADTLSIDTLAAAVPAEAMAAAPAGYQVLLRPLRTSLPGRQGPCRLRPGMDLSADVVTRDTTVLRFLLNRLRIDKPW